MIWDFNIRMHYYTNFGFRTDSFLLLYPISLCLSVVASAAAHCEKPGKWLPLLQDQKLLNGISQK